MRACALAPLRRIHLAVHLPSELQRMGNPVERLRGSTRTAHDHRSEAEDSSEGRLVDADAFNLRDKQFDGAPAEKPRLDENSLVRHRNLRRVSSKNPKPCDRGGNQEEEQSSARRDGMGLMVAGAGPDRAENQDQGCQTEERAHQQGPEEHHPVKLGPVKDCFSWNEILINVAQDPPPFPAPRCVSAPSLDLRGHSKGTLGLRTVLFEKARVAPTGVARAPRDLPVLPLPDHVQEKLHSCERFLSPRLGPWLR